VTTRRPPRVPAAALAAAGAALLLLAGGLGAGPASAEVRFLDPLGNQPLDVPPPEGDARTAAVERFRATGENAYDGDPAATAEGQAIWDEYCQACHLPDGTGRIGPNLVDDQAVRPRTNTDVGRFEILWAGGAGAMQSFADRLSQDQMLKVIAYVNRLRERAAGKK
jgi:cytochrome c-L